MDSHAHLEELDFCLQDRVTNQACPEMTPAHCYSATCCGSSMHLALVAGSTHTSAEGSHHHSHCHVKKTCLQVC